MALPIWDIPPVEDCDCPEIIADKAIADGKAASAARSALRRKGLHVQWAHHHGDEDSRKLKGRPRIDPTGRGNKYYADAIERPINPFVVHMPWSDSSRRAIDNVGFAARVRRSYGQAQGVFKKLHFTISWPGIERFRHYYPVLCQERMETEFFETFQEIPIQLSRKQITTVASGVGILFRGKPGYALERNRDVYSGLTPELDPETARKRPYSEDLNHQDTDQQGLILTPRPIFPNSDQIDKLCKLLFITLRSAI